MHRILLLTSLVIAACSSDAAIPAPGPRKAAPANRAQFQASCSSSSDCSHNSNGCFYCYGGVCSCTLPAEPIRDAGVPDVGP